MLVGLAAILLFAACFPAPAETAGNLFDDTSIHDLYLSVDPSDWASLKEHYLDNTYYPATLNWNGHVTSLGIRSRGRGSRSPEKPSLDFKFGEFKKGQRFLDLKAVVLRAGTQEATMMRERLAMKVFRRVGLPAPREAPARLFVNGEYFGFFTMAEKIDEVFLQRVFGESDGYLYEWNPDHIYNFEYLGEDPLLYSPVLWEPKTHEDDPDVGPIIAMVRAVNQASDEEFVREVSRFLDLKLFLTHVAVEIYLGDPDGVLNDYYGMNNFYFYRFEGGERSQFLPWDKELSFFHEDRDITQNMDANVLARRAMAIPELRSFYLSTLVRIAGLMGSEPDGWLSQEIERQYTQIRDAARNDPHKQWIVDGVMQPAGPEDFEREVDRLRAFALYRPGVVVAAATAAGYSDSARPALHGLATAPSGTVPVMAPGSLASVWGRELAAHSALPGMYPYPLPRELGNTSVAINGVRAPLLYVSPEQINIQVPWDVDTGRVDMVVNRGGELSQPETAYIVQAWPGLFLAAHKEGAPVSSLNPAKGGETIYVYATGLGSVNAVVPSGKPPAGDLRAETLYPLSATIGEQSAPCTARLAAGMVGIYEIEMEVPAGTPSGTAVPLMITSGTASDTIMIAVK